MKKMAFNKFYTRTKKINGKEYTAQFNGLSAALDAIDDSYIDGGSNISSGKLTKYVLENVIVQPSGLTADDFDSMTELNEVVKFGRDVMQGKLKDRPNENESSTK